MRVVDLGTKVEDHVSWASLETARLLYPDAFGDPAAFSEPFDPAFKETRTAAEQALTQATWLLDTLTNGKLHGVECWIEDYAVHSCEVKLRRGPVLSVDAVEIVNDCGRRVDPLPFDGWCLKSPNVISVCCNCSFAASRCGCGTTIMRVKYQIDSNMPPGAAGIVAMLAAEYAKARRGEKCSLPSRISSITRQGVSWTMLDPQDFLEKGRTGMDRVDEWLEAAKRQTGSGTLIDPLHSDRVSMQRVPCGPVAQFGDQDVSDPTPDPFSSAFRRNSIPGQTRSRRSNQWQSRKSRTRTTTRASRLVPATRRR